MRHGHCAAVGKWLAGRTPGLHLDAQGTAEAAQLAERLAREKPRAIYSSPLARALETATIIARRIGLGVITAPDLTDIDYGAWTRCRFDFLATLPKWDEYNQHRSQVAPPSGEAPSAAQQRALNAIERIVAGAQPGAIVVVTHLDIIRSLLCYYAGESLDNIHRFDVAPGTATMIEVDSYQRPVPGPKGL